MQQREYPQGRDQWRGLPVKLSDDRLDIGGFQVMQRWEGPLMLAMAERVMIDRPRAGQILEVGFGMAISANMIMSHEPTSYTVIEAHPEIAENARQWGVEQSVPVTVHEGFFQDVAPELDERFDGILFDPYPITADEWFTYHLEFMPIARDLLRPGGTFVYFAGQTTRFSEEHAEAMLKLFDDVRLFRVGGLEVPEDCDYWHGDDMVLASGHLGREVEV
jgi:guanidinoacetate N-methyltransferase